MFMCMSAKSTEHMWCKKSMCSQPNVIRKKQEGTCLLDQFRFGFNEAAKDCLTDVKTLLTGPVTYLWLAPRVYVP